MDTSVYIFYATFSFICSLIFLLAFGAGLYSIYLKKSGQIPEEGEETTRRFSFLYKKKSGIWLIVIGIIFGIVGYRTQPTKMGATSMEAVHAIHKEELKKAHEAAAHKTHKEIAGEAEKKGPAEAEKIQKREKPPEQPAVAEQKTEVHVAAKKLIAPPSKDQTAKLKNEIADLLKDSSLKEKKIKLLELELAKIKAALAEKELQNKKSLTALSKLKKDLTALQKKFHEGNSKAAQNIKLKNQLKQTCEELKKAKEAAAALETQLKQARSELKTAKEAAAALQQKLKETQAGIEAVQKERDTLKAQLDKAAASIKQLEKEREALRKDLKTRADKRVLQALKDENSKLKKQLHAMNEALDMKVIELTELNSKFQFLQDQAKIKDEKIRRLMETSDALQDRISFFTTKIRTLESELKTRDNIIRQLREKLEKERFNEQAGDEAAAAPEDNKAADKGKEKEK